MTNSPPSEPHECALYPLFYFHPDWPKKTYTLAHGVSLVKPGSNTVIKLLADLTPWCQVAGQLESIRDSLGHCEFDDYWPLGCPIWAASPWQWEDVDLEWFLRVDLPHFAQEPSVADTGIDMKSELADDFLLCFVSCLKLLDDRSAFAPVRLRAPLGTQGPVFEEARLASAIWKMARDDPGRYAASPLKERDHSILKKVWIRVAKLQGLTDWRQHIRQPRAFEQALWQAGAVTGDGKLSGWMEYFEEGWGVSMTRKEAQLTVQYMQEKVGRPLRERLAIYKDVSRERRALFRRRFREVRAQIMEQIACATRIGRAVSLLLTSFNLPPVHRLLSTCALLETLLKTKTDPKTDPVRGGMGEYLAPRVGKVLERGSGSHDAKDDSVVRLYRTRNEFIHGTRAASRIHWIDTRISDSLARTVVLTILCDKTLFGLFSGEAEPIRKFLKDC